MTEPKQGDSGAPEEKETGAGDTGIPDKDGKTSESGAAGEKQEEKDVISRADFESLERRMKAADKRAAALEKENQEFKNRDKTELEKAQGEREKLQSEHSQLQARLRERDIKVAFLSFPGVQWHNPATAFELIKKDLEGVEIDDDGKVPGLKDIINKRIKSDPYLVKSEETNNQRSGETGAGRNPVKEKHSRAEFAQRFPFLGGTA